MTSKLAARLAVLIDAENAQAALTRAVLNEASKYGRAVVRRAYADWNHPQMREWKAPLLAHSIKGIQQFAYTPQKNATDSALIIDAMDLLHTKQLEGFCIVSSDSDFTPLAIRIRESDMMVYGFGHRHTPQPFIKACDKFTFVEDIVEDIVDAEQLEAPQISSAVTTPPEDDMVFNGFRCSRSQMKILLDTVKASANEEGWANLVVVEDLLEKQYGSSTPHWFGSLKLSEILKRTGFFDIDHRNFPTQSGGIFAHIYVRDKHFGRSKDAAIVSDERLDAPQASSTVDPPPKQPTLDLHSILCDPQLGEILRGAVAAVSDKEGWARLGQVKKCINIKHQNLAARWFGQYKIGQIVNRTGLFDVDYRLRLTGDGDKRKSVYVRDKGFRPLTDAVIVPGEQLEASEAIPAVTTPSQEHTTSVVLEEKSAMEKILQRAVAAFSDEEGWANWYDVLRFAREMEPDLCPGPSELSNFVRRSGLFDFESRMHKFFIRQKRVGRSMETVAYDDERPAAPQASPIVTASPQEHMSSIALETNAQLDREGNVQREKEINAQPETNIQPEKKSDAHLEKETNAQLRTWMSDHREKEIATELERTLRNAIKASPSDKEGWSDLVKVHDHVSRRRPGFSARRLGYSNFFDLVTAIGPFETRQTVEKDTRCMYVRVRPDESKGGVVDQYE